MKKLFLKMLLFSCMFLFFNCQNDDLEKDMSIEKEHDGYFINQIRFKELKENSKALQKVREAGMRNASLTGRGVFDEDYGVFIDTSYILMIEKYNYRSITFQIINEENDNEIKNLILTSVDGTDYKAYTATYSLSEAELEKVRNGETLTDKVPSSINEVSQYARGGVLGDGADCIDMWTYTELYCKDSGGRIIRDNGELGNGCVGMSWEVEHQVLKIDAECMSGGGGTVGPSDPSNPGNPGTNPGGGGSSPGTGTNPVNPTTPNPEDPIYDTGSGSIITIPIIRTTKKPCEQLSKMTTIPNYEQNINLLKQRAQGTKEYAWAYKYSGTTGTFFSGTIVGDSQANPNRVNLSAFIGGDYVGAAHNHPNPNTTDGIAMFSPGDIRWLFQCAKKHNTNGQPKDYSLYFLLLIVEGRNYAIKIKDGNKFQLNFNAKFPAIERDLKKRYEESTQYADAFTLQKDLLKVLKENDIGIGLYEEIEANGSKTWNELTLDPINPAANPIKKPCN